MENPREIVQNKKRLRKEFWKTSKCKSLLEREEIRRNEEEKNITEVGKAPRKMRQKKEGEGRTKGRESVR